MVAWIVLLEEGELLPKAQGLDPHVLWVEKEQLQEEDETFPKTMSMVKDVTRNTNLI